MSRLMEGAMLVLFFVIVQMLVAITTTGSTSGASYADCTGSTCEGEGEANFLLAVLNASFTGIDGMPALFNTVYVTIMGFLLTLGVTLVAVSFVPITSA